LIHYVEVALSGEGGGKAEAYTSRPRTRVPGVSKS
jgi:hypothetical protein